LEGTICAIDSPQSDQTELMWEDNQIPWGAASDSRTWKQKIGLVVSVGMSLGVYEVKAC
jgi:hypothetical protein